MPFSEKNVTSLLPWLLFDTKHLYSPVFCICCLRAREGRVGVCGEVVASSFAGLDGWVGVGGWIAWLN